MLTRRTVLVAISTQLWNRPDVRVEAFVVVSRVSLCCSL